MEFKKIAKGVKIPVLGLGTWDMGGEMSPDNSHDKECIAALRHGINLGMTHIDTAEMYGDGHTEQVVGEAIKPFDRKKLFITTKVWQTNLRYNDLINSAKRSLKRLGIKYADMYLIHVPNPNIPIEETMNAMDALVEKRLVRFIGVSNFSVKELKEAQNHSENEIVANQIEYNLLIRNKRGIYTENMESEIIPYCQKNGVMVVAYRPLAKGMITGYSIPLLNGLSKKYNKTPSQIALNWLISKERVIAIPKASNIKHVEENAGAIGWKLNKEDIEKLDKL